jgi:hypothetical protein
MKCGDPTGFLPEWRDVDFNIQDCKMRAYITGENLEIDCTSVIDDMFVVDKDLRYTYGFSSVSEVLRHVKYPERSCCF